MTLQQRTFAETVAANDAEPLARRQIEREIFEQLAPAKFQSDIPQFDDTIRQLRRRRNDQLDIYFLFRRLLRRHFEITLDAIDRFRPPRARPFAHPFEFFLQKLLPLALLLFLDRLALRLGQQVIVVTARRSCGIFRATARRSRVAMRSRK